MNLVIDVAEPMKKETESEKGAQGSSLKQSSPRDMPYRPAPASLVHRVSLGELIDDARTVTPGQQERFGFRAEGLNLDLWCAGDLTLAKLPAVSIVGTRKVSSQGAARARRLARELAEAGVVVVSGLAKGVDTEALTAAMEAGGRVIAVIGTPIDKAYPAENKRLQESIYSDHLLVSQFAPGQRVYPSHFPERNKLMAALSDATAIIEAGETSGTLHQAAECTRLGRWLFVAKSLMDDEELLWPSKFATDPHFEVLRSTSDILSKLRLPQSCI